MRADFTGGICQKCGSHWLYHDYDPTHRHDGITCQTCGFEQVLSDGSKSRIPNGRGHRR